MQIPQNIFRAYDIRGKYPEEIDEELSLLIGQAFGSKLILKGINKCYIGHDNRLSSEPLKEKLIEGVLSTGVNVLDCGLVTTPMIYFIRNHTKIFASVMITASHNPGNENGFKFSYDETGNVKGEEVLELYNFLMKGQFKDGKGSLKEVNIKDTYIKALMADLKFNKKRDLKIIVDMGNGVTTSIVKDVFKLLPYEIKYICDESDGTFPVHHPDPCIPENLELLKEEVIKEKASLGISFDGDGDRLGIIDNLGIFVPADIFCGLYIKDILSHGGKNKILYDLKCSKALKEIIEKYQGIPIESRTGASYTMSSVINEDCAFGVEYSGHIYFNDRKLLPISSGLYAGLRLIEILSNSSFSINDLLKEIPRYYKLPEMRIPVLDEKKYEIVEEIRSYVNGQNLKHLDIDGIKVLYNNSWVLVRASNTGPNLTFIVESNTLKELNELKDEYLKLITK